MLKTPWFPTIHLDKCDRCEKDYKCVTFCPNGVLEIREDNVFVVNPLGCVYPCTSCANLCPKDAILFPNRLVSSRSKNKSTLYKIVCKGCGKKVSSSRKKDYCFDCEKVK